VDISVVVPASNSAGTLKELVDRLVVALVDDGSKDASWTTIEGLVLANDCVRGVRLGRNVGQHGALLAGLRLARHSITVTLDDDLQNPPEEIPRLVAALNVDVDLVYGMPLKVSQAAWRRIGSSGIRNFIVRFLDGTDSADMSSFRAFKTHLREAFSASTGPSVSIDALLTWGTNNIGYVDVDHKPRTSGTSNYNLRKLIRFSVDVATGYSSRPLRLASAVGALCVLLAVLLSTVTASITILGGQKVPGFATTIVVVCLFSGVQMLSLGILGEYIARMHFRIMNKPTYFVADVRENGDDSV
jgi:glycosyltransferase involved in cell wall biosynthesis